MQRKDYRSHEQFAQDIMFTTKIETFLWKIFCKRILKDYDFVSEDYGTDNSGKIVTRSSSKADYRLKITIDNIKYDLLLEIKFGTNSSKLTFKIQDLESYIKQNANILLFYNTGPEDLKKPKDYNLTEHYNKIINNINHIKYALLSGEIMKKMLESYPHEKVYYMGNKLSIIVPSSDFSKFFEGKQL